MVTAKKPLESLHRLSLVLGHTLNKVHEARLFVEWVFREAGPCRVALFETRGRVRLSLVATRGFTVTSGEIPFDTNVWEWLEEQGENLQNLPKRALLPIVVEGEIIGLLALAAETSDAEWEEICTLVDTGLIYLAPVLRNIERYTQIEQLVEERTAALRESEERFRMLAEHSLTGIYLIQDGLFRYVNPTLANIFKYTPEELIDRLGPLDLTHPDDREMVQEYIHQRVSGKIKSIQYRFRGLCKDGTIRIIEVHGTQAEYRNRPAIIGTLLDVTEQVRHERELEAEAMMAKAIAEESALQPLLERLLAAARHVIPTAEKGSILLLEDDGLLHIRALNGYTDPRLYHFTFAREKGYSARALRERRPLRIDDARADAEIRYDGEIEEARQIQSAIVAPLVVHEQPIGVLALDATRKAAFTDEDLETLTGFTTQAALLIERERLFEATREQVRQLEMLYRSGLKFAQALTVDDVAQALIETLAERFSWHHLAVRLLDAKSQEFNLVAFATPPILDEEQKRLLVERWRTAIRTPQDGLTGLAFRQGHTILAPDVHSFPEYVETATEIRSGIYVPLKGEKGVIGVITIESEQPAAFDQADARLLETIAAQATVAFERARWIAETQRRVEETAAMLAASRALNHLDLQQTLETIVTHARQLFQADSCRIFLLEEQGETLRCAVVSGEDPEAFENLRIRLNQGVTGAVAASGQAEIVNDMSQDARAIVVPGTEDLPEAAMFAPLKARERILGVLSVHRQGVERPFVNSDLDLLQAFAAMAASAVSNALLFADVKQRLHELELMTDVSAAMRRTQSVNEMIPIVVSRMAQLVGAAIGSIYLRESTQGDWVAHGWVNAEGRWLLPTAEMRHAPGEGVTGWVGEHGEIYITEDWRNDPITRVLPGEEVILQPYRTGISIPLRSGEETIGVVHLWSVEKRIFSGDEKRLLLALADMAGTALKRAALFEETLRRVQQLQAVHEIDNAIRTSLNLDVLLNVLLRHVLSLLQADAAGVLLYNEEKQMLESVLALGLDINLYRTSLKLGEGLAGRVALKQQALYVPDLKSARVGSVHPILEQGFQSYAASPLVAKSRLLGVIEVFFRNRFFFDAELKRVFEMLAQQAAIAVESIRTFQELQQAHANLILAYDETIEGWSRALDLRDRETEGHTQRVTELTVRLAQAMGLPPEQIVHIRRGALLHDIGKMGVPDAILFKEGSLTEEEWAIMRRHPQFAYEMLSEIDYLQPALDIPYCHHERWDGSGYPRGLKGEEIPLAARLFAVADVYDALTSDRPYRKAWSKEEALEYIRQQAGRQFDPQVAELFIKMMQE